MFLSFLFILYKMFYLFYENTTKQAFCLPNFNF